MEQCIIPQELIEIIVSRLDADIQALRCCSLVCWAWLPLSQAHIFRKICFRPPPSRRREDQEEPIHPADTEHRHPFMDGGSLSGTACSRFYHILQTSPHLARYVREVSIQEGGLRTGWRYLGVHWCTRDDTLPLALSSLRELSSVQSFRLLGASLVWSSLPQPLQDSIREFVSSPQLLELDFTDVNFDDFAIQDILRHAPFLKKLKLCELSATYQDDAVIFGDSFIPAPHRPSLEALTLLDNVQMYQILQWILHPTMGFDITSLQSLRIAFVSRNRGEMDMIERILDQSSDSLESLHFQPVHSDWPDSNSFIDITAPRRLKSLRASSDISAFCNPLRWLAAMFGQISTTNNLEMIRIDLRVNPDNGQLTEIMAHPWHELDAVLNQPKFDLVKLIEVTVFDDSCLELDRGSSSQAQLTQSLNLYLKEIRQHLPMTSGRDAFKMYQLEFKPDPFYWFPGPPP